MARLNLPSTARWLEFALRGIPDLSAAALGLYRLVLGALLFFAVWLTRLAPGPFPRDMHQRTAGPANWEGFHWLASRPDLVATLETATLAALLLFAFGLLTRASLAIAAAGLLTWTFVRLQHTGAHDWAVALPMMVGILPVAWGDGFSVDEMIRRWRGRAAPPGRHGQSYGFGVWLPGFVLGLAFAAAASAKLRRSGLAWITGGAVKYHFVIDAWHAPVDWGLWVASHHSAAVAMSFVAIAIEGGVIAASFVRRGILRTVSGFAALSLLAGFYLFQHELWIAWWVLCSGLMPWGGIFDAMASRVPRAVALVDGSCPLCRRAARVLHGLDWFDRIEFADVNDAAVRARYVPSIPLERLLIDVHVVRLQGGEPAAGYRAYVRLAGSMPFAWPLLALALLPPIRAVGDRIYGSVARSRLRHLPCTDESCGLQPERIVRGLPPTAHDPRGPIDLPVRPFQLAVIALVCVPQAIGSVVGIEIQPWLTDYAMYSNTYPSTDAFDAANPVKRVYHLSRDAGAGQSEDITKIMDDIPEADAVVIDAVYALLGRPDGLAPDQKAKVRATAELFRKAEGRPLGRVTLLMDEEIFDWERGRFFWKKRGSPVGTLDTEAMVLVK